MTKILAAARGKPGSKCGCSLEATKAPMKTPSKTPGGKKAPSKAPKKMPWDTKKGC